MIRTSIQHIYNKVNKKTYYKYVCIQILFLIFSLIISWFYLRSNTIAIGNPEATSSDGLYHLQEIHELLLDFSQHILPSFNHFLGIQGSAISTFYPWTSFISILIGSIMHIPLSINLKIFDLLAIFLTCNICFYSAKSYWHSNKMSLLFTLIITATLNISDFSYTNDFSIALGTPLLVMCMFGWLALIRYNHWKMLTISMILLTYIHFVSAYLAVITLILLTILTLKKWNKEKIVSGIKATILTILATAMIWIPLLILKCTNSIYTPIGHYIQDNKGNNMMGLQTIPIMYFIVAIIVILHIKKLNIISIITLAISIIYMSITFNVIPLHIMQHTPIIPIQYAYRLGNMSFILMSIIGTPVIYKLLTRKEKHHNLIIYMLIFAVIIPIVTIYHLSFYNTSQITTHQQMQHMLLAHNALSTQMMKIMLNQHKYNSFANLHTLKPYRNNYYLDEFMPSSTQKYYGKQYPSSLRPQTISQSYIPNIVMQYDMYKNHMHNINNGISTNYKESHNNVLLPIILYHGQKYSFYINGKQFKPYKYKHHEPVIHYLPKGYNKITFKTPIMWYRYLSIIISVLTILIAIGYNFRKQAK